MPAAGSGRSRRAHARFEFPKQLWRRLRPNLGYWWFVAAIGGRDGDEILSASEIRCFIRHRAMARIPDSGLRYADEGNLPVVDLGTTKGEPDDWALLPLRPQLGRRRNATAFDGPRRFAAGQSSS